MSTIWTPSGERPIRQDDPAPGPERPNRAGGPGPERPDRAGSTGPEHDSEAVDTPQSEEEVRAQMADVERELAATPASVVVVNHCIGLFQLAALHLGQQPPKLGDAKLAIDAMGAIVEALGARLGDDYRALEEALTSIRLGFVQAQRAAGDGGASS